MSHAPPVLADGFFTTAPPGKPQLTSRGYLNCNDEDPKAKSLLFEKENYKHQDWRVMRVNHAFAVPSLSLLYRREFEIFKSLKTITLCSLAFR